MSFPPIASRNEVSVSLQTFPIEALATVRLLLAPGWREPGAATGSTERAAQRLWTGWKEKAPKLQALSEEGTAGALGRGECVSYFGVVPWVRTSLPGN